MSVCATTVDTTSSSSASILDLEDLSSAWIAGTRKTAKDRTKVTNLILDALLARAEAETK